MCGEQLPGLRHGMQGLMHSFIHSFSEHLVSTYCVPDLCYGPEGVLLSWSPQPHVCGLDTWSSYCPMSWLGCWAPSITVPPQSMDSVSGAFLHHEIIGTSLSSKDETRQALRTAQHGQHPP